ncbi:MAG: hypothetical protein IJV00_05990 [Clostridia bacterium]|nr:hypothetical protein [Clostridia bacterium]
MKPKFAKRSLVIVMLIVLVLSICTSFVGCSSLPEDEKHVVELFMGMVDRINNSKSIKIVNCDYFVSHTNGGATPGGYVFAYFAVSSGAGSVSHYYVLGKYSGGEVGKGNLIIEKVEESLWKRDYTNSYYVEGEPGVDEHYIRTSPLDLTKINKEIQNRQAK